MVAVALDTAMVAAAAAVSQPAQDAAKLAACGAKLVMDHDTLFAAAHAAGHAAAKTAAFAAAESKCLKIASSKDILDVAFATTREEATKHATAAASKAATPTASSKLKKIAEGIMIEVFDISVAQKLAGQVAEAIAPRIATAAAKKVVGKEVEAAAMGITKIVFERCSTEVSKEAAIEASVQAADEVADKAAEKATTLAIREAEKIQQARLEEEKRLANLAEWSKLRVYAYPGLDDAVWNFQKALLDKLPAADFAEIDSMKVISNAPADEVAARIEGLVKVSKDGAICSAGAACRLSTGNGKHSRDCVATVWRNHLPYEVIA